MAVYTQVSAEDMAMLIEASTWALVSAKGIAEGVENSNYLVDTAQGRYILTVYEKRVDTGDLPFFLNLLDHLADKGCPVPRTMHDARGLRSKNGTAKRWRSSSFCLVFRSACQVLTRPKQSASRWEQCRRAADFRCAVPIRSDQKVGMLGRKVR